MLSGGGPSAGRASGVEASLLCACCALGRQSLCHGWDSATKPFFCRPFGTRFPICDTNPGLTSWAKICRPFGALRPGLKMRCVRPEGCLDCAQYDILLSVGDSKSITQRARSLAPLAKTRGLRGNAVGRFRLATRPLWHHRRPRIEGVRRRIRHADAVAAPA